MHIAIFGCGNMGKALLTGLLKSFGNKCRLSVFDVSSHAVTGLPECVDIKKKSTWFSNNKDIPDAIIIAVKPADIASVLLPVKKTQNADKPLWISVAAGVSISSLSAMLPGNSRICRVMPNTPVMVGKGMSAFSINDLCTDSDSKLAQSILNSCGKSIAVPEKYMDAITGLSGSGPAYVYLFIEALIEGGVSAGLPYAIAYDCAVQTVMGASAMVEETKEHPALLKMKVMSPAGTTAQGCSALESHSFKYSVIDAVCKAASRSSELGST